MARYEPYSKSNILSYYNYKIRQQKPQHHNDLWRKIYCDLKICNHCDKPDVIIKNKEYGFDCFFKREEDNNGIRTLSGE